MVKHRSEHVVLRRISEEYHLEPFPRLSSPEKLALLNEIVEIGTSPAEFIRLYEQHGNDLIWVLQYAVSDMLWDTNLTTSQKSAMLNSLPLALASLTRTDGSAINHFWLGVLDFRELHNDNADADDILRAVLRALEIQIAIPNAGLQRSAINGLREVGGSEAISIIRRSIPRFVDDTVRSYAGLSSAPDDESGSVQPTDRI